jgi:Na+/H+ antiporter NhaD/arsenite permease-like protein
MQLSKQFRSDSSAVFLIISNLITIILAVYEKWDLSEIMWIYWGQSVIIGYFNWKRILDLKQFSTSGFRINDQPTKPTKKTQKATATFFAVHYGFFHLVYSVFLFDQTRSFSSSTLLFILLCVVIFFFNHRFSYFHNRERDMKRTPNIGTIMFFPYLRIIPMHLTIIIGSSFAKGSSGALILFLGLKTIADLIMHMIEHADARQSI